MKFKDILLNLLKKNNLTSKQLSEESEIPLSTINGWIFANRFPRTKILIKLKRYFKVSMDYLLGLEDESGKKLY